MKPTDNSNNLDSLESYDTLECPRCEKLCKPVEIKPNGTVVYKRHMCEGYGHGYYTFSIDINGDLIE